MNKQTMTTSVLAAIIFVVFVGTLYFNFTYKASDVFARQLVADITVVHDALQKIHADCGIIDFDYTKNIINFLNVKSFAGSEVGSVNLVYPDKWQGPYVDDNPTFQEKEYQVIVTDNGMFIVPGDGVKLPNGHVVGVDISLKEDTDIIALMANTQALRHKKYIFAKTLVFEKQVDDRLAVMSEV